MRFLDQFLDSYKNLHTKKSKKSNNKLINLIDECKEVLLQESMQPSNELKNALNKLNQRASEPMKVAIVGQFSSGKSTFLNALLGRDILPTGITPVTSKVGYIKYAEDLKMQIHYKNGKDEYVSVEQIATFTDQRENVEEIEHLTLYYPMELLKNITFVDTPGLNSQSISDTTETQKVLKEVDGIIWLSLIDNAGKQSEAEVLEKYLSKYGGKTLCVLNQKDKFKDEQVQTSLQYVKKAFAKYFADVIPISAIEAVKSRASDKQAMIDEQKNTLLQKIKNSLDEDNSDISLHVEEYKKNSNLILKSDANELNKLLKKSNITKVLDFIYKEIQPKSEETKELSIKDDIKIIGKKAIEQEEIFMKANNELTQILKEYKITSKERMKSCETKYNKELKKAYLDIEEIMHTVAKSIYENRSTFTKTKYAKSVIEVKDGMFGTKTIDTYAPSDYKAPKLDYDMVYRNLFYHEEVVPKMFKKYVRNLNKIQDDILASNKDLYSALSDKIKEWQRIYESLHKTNPLHSDIAYANLRNFSSKVYENILKPFSDEFALSYASISQSFNHLSSSISYNYENATGVCISYFQKRIENSIPPYEKDSIRFNLYEPKLDEIQKRLHTTFYLEEINNIINSENTFLSQNYAHLNECFAKIIELQEQMLTKIQKTHQAKIQKINALIDSIG